jgi:ribosomal protein S18 acetylase RimI-like enzyme
MLKSTELPSGEVVEAGAPNRDSATGGGAPAPLTLVPATLQDLPMVLSILTEAAAWAQQRGALGLWQVPYPEAWVRPSVARGEVYLASRRGEPVGTLTFRWDDPQFWGERPPDAGYVHRLAIRRSAAGDGVGEALLEWAERRVADARRPYLRLDCRSTHAGLRRYYRSAGFEIVGVAMVGEMEVVLWQRAVRTTLATRILEGGPAP